MSKTIMQDMQVQEGARYVQSSATELECCVCGKKFEDGYTITAKTMVHGTFMLCDSDYSLRWIVKPRA